MKIRQIISILAVCSMLFVLCTCGESASSAEPTAAAPVQETEASADTADFSESEASTEKSEDTAFEKITVIDNADCTIQITGIDPDNLFGYTLKTFVENKSTDTTYMVLVETASINGVMCDPFFAAEVPAGKKANSEISFSTSELEKNGIGDFTDIEITFRVYDSDDWSADDIAMETVHIYPYGESSASVYVREPQPSDVILIENENIAVIMTGVAEDPIWGYTVNLYLENKTDTNVMFSVEDASVNGYMLDPFWASEVDAQKCKFTSISWTDSSLEENGINTVTEIELTIQAYDDDDWAADHFAEETVTIHP